MSKSNDRESWEEWVRRSPEERVIEVLAHVFFNLRDLPEFACEDSPLRVPGTYWSAAYIAAVESYLMNARLAADFLVRPPDKRDYTAHTFVRDWVAPEPLAGRLMRVWWLASREVAHLSRERLPTDISKWAPEDQTFGGLMRISRDCHRMLGLFVGRYEVVGGPWVTEFRDLYRITEMTSQRDLKAMRADALRQGKTLLRPQPLQPGRRGAWPEE